MQGRLGLRAPLLQLVHLRLVGRPVDVQFLEALQQAADVLAQRRGPLVVRRHPALQGRARDGVAHLAHHLHQMSRVRLVRHALHQEVLRGHRTHTYTRSLVSHAKWLEISLSPSPCPSLPLHSQDGPARGSGGSLAPSSLPPDPLHPRQH